MGKRQKQKIEYKNKKLIKSQRENKEKYKFSLKALPIYKSNCYYENVNADFQPILTTAGIRESILPTFNFDKKYWTKSFIIGLRKEYYLSNPLKQKQKFAEKYRRKTYYQQLSSQQELSIIRPLPNKQYCYICCGDMKKNYYEHIKEKQHVEKQNRSLATIYIQELIQRIQIKQ